MTTAKQARNSHFQKGTGVYACRSCGHKTRSTGQGDNEQVQLCTICWDLAGETNHLSDNSKLYSSAAEVTSLMNELRNRAKDPVALFPEIAAYLERLATFKAEIEPAVEGKLEFFVFVDGIDGDPEFVMIFEAPNDTQAKRVAKRAVEMHRSIDGLTFRTEQV